MYKEKAPLYEAFPFCLRIKKKAEAISVGLCLYKNENRIMHIIQEVYIKLEKEQFANIIHNMLNKKIVEGLIIIINKFFSFLTN
jgi:hypothetical protein